MYFRTVSTILQRPWPLAGIAAIPVVFILLVAVLVEEDLLVFFCAMSDALEHEFAVNIRL